MSFIYYFQFRSEERGPAGKPTNEGDGAGVAAVSQL